MNNIPLGHSDIAKINQKLSECEAFISHNGLILDSRDIFVEIYTAKDEKAQLYITTTISNQWICNYSKI